MASSQIPTSLVNYDAFLFDLDGTLIDSAHDLVQSANDLYALHNYPLITFEEGREVASDGIKAYLNLISYFGF